MVRFSRLAIGFDLFRLLEMFAIAALLENMDLRTIRDRFSRRKARKVLLSCRSVPYVT